MPIDHGGQIFLWVPDKDTGRPLPQVPSEATGNGLSSLRLPASSPGAEFNQLPPVPCPRSRSATSPGVECEQGLSSLQFPTQDAGLPLSQAQIATVASVTSSFCLRQRSAAYPGVDFGRILNSLWFPAQEVDLPPLPQMYSMTKASAPSGSLP